MTVTVGKPKQRIGTDGTGKPRVITDQYVFHGKQQIGRLQQYVSPYKGKDRAYFWKPEPGQHHKLAPGRCFLSVAEFVAVWE